MDWLSTRPLTVGAITECVANEVTVSSNFVVGGTLLVDTNDASLATEMSINDNVVVGLTTANKNSTVNGTLDVSNFWAPKPWVGF